MPALKISLCIALVGPLALVAAVRAVGAKSLSWSTRLMFWLLAAATLLPLAWYAGTHNALVLIGLRPFTGSTLGVASILIPGLLVTAAVLTVIQRILGSTPGDRETFAAIAATPMPLRVFIVLTAAAWRTLFRGIGIGVGTLELGLWPAALLSIAAFVAAHARWHGAHLVQVAAAGSIMAATFALSGDLVVCVLAHLAVGAIGFIADLRS